MPALLGSILFFSGCATTRPEAPPATFVTFETSPGEEVAADALAPSVDRKTLLLTEADAWAGTPHVWGGTTRAGVDCSSFVQHVYKDAFGVALPRTTAQQARLGELVMPNQLDAGDLVFYKIDRSTRHVGIYLGDNNFVHASKSDGVIVSSLNEPYWQRRFWKIKRILPPEAKLTAEGESLEASEKKRNGW